MSEQEEIDVKIEQWHATPTNVSMAIGSFGLTSTAVCLATHSPGGMILGAAAAWAAARHGDDVANAARTVASQVNAVVKALQGQKEAQPKDGRDDPRTERLGDATFFDFDEEDDDEEIKPVSHKSDIFRFSELLASGFVPSVRKIFVGRTMDGKDIFISAEDLCHVALAGKTGGGKGSLMRLLMVQLCYIGTKVLLLNPHYMRWVRAKDGAEFDEDWTPFEGTHPRTNKPYLTKSPLDCADYPPIGERLEWAVKRLLQERKIEGREGDKLFKPYFIVLDEWPSVVDEIKTAPGHLAKLLREGRKYGVFVIVASQDFQVKTIGMEGGSVRKCLLTTYYTGGDATTARELLNEPGLTVNENELGKGKVYLKCAGTQNKPVLVCVPFVDNESVYRLLGPSTFRKAKPAVPRQDESLQIWQQQTVQNPVSFSSERHMYDASYAQNFVVRDERNENERTMKGLLERDENDESLIAKDERNETFMASNEDETTILMAVIDLQMAGVKVTREAIKQKLKWNNAKHPAIKFVCDKHKIAMR